MAAGHTTGNVGYCWGINGPGQLGTGEWGRYSTASPLAVLGGLSFLGIQSGDHTCGFTNSAGTGGLMYCWGNNERGQRGNNTTTVVLAPTPVTLPSSSLQLPFLGARR